MNKQSVIITVPNPTLKKAATPVASFDKEIKDKADTLLDSLRNADFGIGLAGNQIGMNASIFVAEYNDKDGKESIPLTFFINPKIVEYSKEEVEMEEGCLSVPRLFLDVVRPESIKIKAQDRNGKIFKMTARGLFARLIQHEVDHLNGRVFTDELKFKLHRESPELKKLKIVFVGSGDFAEIVARGMILLDFNIPLIITETPKESGRSKKLCLTPVAKTAQVFGKKFIETSKISELKAAIKELEPDLMLLTDFGQIIPKEILDLPKIAAINIHPSLLPRYRGSTPIQTAILNGDKTTGISIIKMNEKIDKGEVLYQTQMDISEEEDAISLEMRLASLSLKSLVKFLPHLQNKDFKAIVQDEAQATYTKKLSKTDGEIDWEKSASDINRQVHAYFPWPGSFTFIGDKRFIIHSSHLEDGKLVLDVVQAEGGKVIFFDEFLKGYRGPKPTWFAKIHLEKK